jgi:hypothetical protein
MEGESEIEIRPLCEAADFGAEVEGAANKPR